MDGKKEKKAKKERRNQLEYSPMELLSMDLSETYVASGLEVGERSKRID